jgi:dTDP-4-dehydrorhamnose reductase
MKVMIVGAAGQLGLVMTREFLPCHEVLPLAMSDLDITDGESVNARVVRERPDLVINCAAYNDVDGAEDHALAAMRVNALAVRGLAHAAAGIDAVLVHYGSDFVFDGLATRPYCEDDMPRPQCVYACSKLCGDWFAMTAPRHYVLRVESLFGGSAQENYRGPSTIDRIIDSLASGGAPKVFTDRTVSPSYVLDVARATRELVEGGAPYGLYHCVNSGHCTWYDLAVEVARHLPGAGQPVPASVADVRLKAARPQFAAMANAKLESVGVRMPSWQDVIARYVPARVGS